MPVIPVQEIDRRLGYLVSEIVQSLLKKMTTEKWNDIYVDSEDDWYHTFITSVHQIFQQSFALVQLSRQRLTHKPWITKGLKISIKHKSRLYKSQSLRPRQQQLVRYNRYKNLLRKCLKEAETNYYQEVFNSNKNSVHNIWKTLNPIINQKAVSKSILSINYQSMEKSLKIKAIYLMPWIIILYNWRSFKGRIRKHLGLIVLVANWYSYLLIFL